MKTCQVKSSWFYFIDIITSYWQRVTWELAWKQSWAKWTWATQWRETVEPYEKWLLCLPSQHPPTRSGLLTVEVMGICSSLREQKGGNRHKYWRECISEILSTWSKTNKQATPKANLEKLIGILGCTIQPCCGYYLVLGGLGTLVIIQTNKLPEALIKIQIRLRL